MELLYLPAAATVKGDRDGNYEIYTMDEDGANQRRLTNNFAADNRPA